MATWSWWIVILCSKDYYTYYDGAKVVRARTEGEAERKARPSEQHYEFVADIFGPFEDQPGRCDG